jgi:protein involved in polysaccharide export with SLBB domain
MRSVGQRNTLWLLIILMSLAPYLISCSTPPKRIQDDADFRVDPFQREIPFATPEVLRAHEANLEREYIIGPGDKLHIEVWNRERLSGEHLVGPFGKITLPMIGIFRIGGLNRQDAAAQIADEYRQYYDEPLVTVKVLKYLNNRVYVLGRVSNPGVIYFNRDATLLEALSLSGGLPTRDRAIFLSKCYIVRGKDQIIWIDLLQLLQKAGSYQIQTAGLTLMDALNLAAGPTEDGNTNEVRLIRELSEQQGVKVVDLDDILARGDFSQNYLLKDNDIIYIPRKGIANFNYFLRQIDPFLRTFLTGAVIHETVIK